MKDLTIPNDPKLCKTQYATQEDNKLINCDAFISEKSSLFYLIIASDANNSVLILGNSQVRIVSEIIYTSFFVGYINTRLISMVSLCSLSSAEDRAVQTCMQVHKPMST